MKTSSLTLVANPGFEIGKGVHHFYFKFLRVFAY